MTTKANITPGVHFEQALSHLELSEDEKTKTTKTTVDIITKIVENYETTTGDGFVGDGGSGVVGIEGSKEAPVGLLYGRIQSGKTRAMILSAALALDNHFRIAVILTSNVNRLVTQTHEDFLDGLTTVPIYSKSDLKGRKMQLKARQIVQGLEDNSYGVVIIGSKGKTVLEQLTELLKEIGAEKYPAIVFDDEGDQATLDTNVSKRARPGKKDTPQSTIHGLVHSEESSSIRKVLPYAVFMSVTGTPQGIFLQNSDSRSRLSFVHLLEPGDGYVGGTTFFGSASIGANPYIQTISEDENIQISEKDIPDGLKDAICFFIVAATAAGLNDKWRPYKMLCHTSVKQTDHETVTELVDSYVIEIVDALRKPSDTSSEPILKRLRNAYEELKKTQTELPSFDDITSTAVSALLQKQSLTINANSSNDTLQYSPRYNFLVGGNTVGRGLAIRDLLVTYYTRQPKSSKADTMYQHARMFGYREPTLPYTRVYMPSQLYVRFRAIWESDEEARKHIEKYGFDEVGALMLKAAKPGIGLKPTRSNVLDPNKVNTIHSGTAIYPKYPQYQAAEASANNERFDKLVAKIAPEFLENKDGSKVISLGDAQRLAKSIKTNDVNGKWVDRHVGNYLETFANQIDKDEVRLEWREARRTLGENGYLDNGVHGEHNGQKELPRWRKDTMPTLFIAKIVGSGQWNEIPFYYPTIVAPEGLGSYIFNKS